MKIIDQKVIGCINLIMFSLFYWVAVCFYQQNNYITAFLLILFGIITYFYYWYFTKNPLSVIAVLGLFYFSSLGLACFKFIGLQEKVIWDIKSWICYFLFYFFFVIGTMCFFKSKTYYIHILEFKQLTLGGKLFPLFIIISVLTFLSVSSFCYFVFICGYIPLFSNDPHAYVNFGTQSSLSLFYQIAVIIPGLSYYEKKRNNYNLIKRIILNICIAFNVLICVLAKSRDFLLGMAIIMLISIFFGLKYNKKTFSISSLKFRYKLLISITVLGAILAFLFVSRQRNYSEEYIYNLFEVIDKKIPASLVSFYTYITMGFYNFNNMVISIAGHSFGLKQLNPIFILMHLTDLKALRFQLPDYLIKNELNLYGYLGDAFYDFGYLGIVILGFVSGWLFNFSEKFYFSHKTSYALVLYAIAIHHSVLIFFSTWLSNFQYFIYTILLLIIALLDSNKFTHYKMKTDIIKQKSKQK